MNDAGKTLRQIRENLRLRYRDVEEASQWIANQHGNHEFLIGLSRLADIENKGTTPSLYRLYSLCAIYRIEYEAALGWYGIALDQLSTDGAHFAAQHTQPFDLETADSRVVSLPAEFKDKFDFRNTDHFSRSIRNWGKLPIGLINGLDLRQNRYGFIGTDDWSMYPIIPPGSFVQLDEKKKKIQKDGWTSEHERPIYFVEHREGFRCGWCSHSNGLLVVQPHYSSTEAIGVWSYPGQAEVIGQVVAVAMRLDLATKRHTHS